MGKQLLTKPEKLKDFIAASGSVDNINEEHLSAIAEAYFRLALNPSTESREALAYLKKGYNIDNVDPRFPYHIARIYFQLKEFNLVQKWLMVAFRLCPTSHRIWAHIGLLQNELNLEFNKQNQFRPDDLKEKAFAINENIINKSDSIDISLLQFEPSRADQVPVAQNDNTALFDNKSHEVSENLSKDSIHDFILNMLKINAELIETAFRSEKPENQLSDIGNVVEILAECGGEINENIENKLGPYCRLAENEIDLTNILVKYKTFYFYLDTLLRINILRRKIKDRSEYALDSLQFENDTNYESNSLLRNTLQKKIDALNIIIGKERMEKIELGIDKSINQIKSTRKIDTNKCRWLGVYDISIENYLQNEASTLFMDKLIRFLEEVAKLIDNRPNGRSALAILCTEWLISGYSPQSIKRILDGLDNKQNDEFTSFIELLCNLFECEIEELPELLASQLKNENISPLLATLILKRRYLWREINYEKNFEFKKSTQIINNFNKNSNYEFDESEVNQYIKILLDGLSGMWNHRKIPFSVKEVIKISEPESSKPTDNKNVNDGSDIFYYFNHFSKLIAEIQKLLEDLQVKCLKDFNSKIKKIENQEDFSYALSTLDLLKSINSIITTITDSSQSAIEKLVAELKDTKEEKKKEIVSGKDKIVNSFKEIENMCPKTGRYDSRILSLGDKFERKLSEADKTLVDLKIRAEKIYNDYIVNSDNAQLFRDLKETQKNRNIVYDKIGLQKSEELSGYRSRYSGIKGLEDAILLIDQEIENILHYSLEAFGLFDESNLKNSYVVDLQIYFLNQAAETYFRLGLYKKAIKYWNHIIILKEIDTAASKNIAIAETMIDQNDENILNAWRKYCEDLYRCDILIGNPQKHAGEREEIHAKLSSVYAPFLTKSKEIHQHDEEEYKVKLQQFVGLINNPTQFYEFIIHKIAELLNKRLGYMSPVVFLGLPISADENAVKRASAAMEDFIKSVSTALPEKIKNPFLDLCLQYLNKSRDFCLDKNNMSLAKNPSYEEDKKRLHEWIRTVLELKETIFIYMKDVQEMTDDLKYIDTIFILDLLNRLPIDIDKGILDDMTFSTFAMYKNTNLAELPEIFANNMIQIPLQSFLKRISEKENPAGLRFYKQIVRILSDGSPYHVDRNAEYIRFIDSPMNFVPDFVKEYIGIKERDLESDQSKQVIKYFTDKCKQYPSITGFARLLSNIDFKTGESFLKGATLNAFNMRIKLECIRELEIGELNADLNSLKKLYNDNKYKNAYDLFITILERLKNKTTILESSLNEMQTVPDRLKNDLLLLTGRYYPDVKEIKKSMQDYLCIKDKELVNEVGKMAVEADITFLRNYLLNIIGGWIKSDPNEVKTYIDEFHKYLSLFKEKLLNESEKEQNDWRNSMNNLLINASIGHLGMVDSQDKLHQAITAMKKLINLDSENDYACYYLALFNQNLAGFIVKQSGINSAKEYFRIAYTISSQLKAKEIDMDENLKKQINQLYQNLEENKDIFLN